MDKQLLATVVSEAKPESGQLHRSSGNFSTDSITPGALYVTFEVVDSPNPDAIHFDVMRDKSVGFDPIEYKNAYSGFQSNNVEPFRSLYIANPENASAPFTVNVYSIS
ncbi:DeoR family transcriptional regulator [Spirosoma aureum]|uniref:DeoR family transcriptional regulator n=1 Tax=Spirosoma aureum TaxID=2692134 RepID=A0A6G9AV43_9BACT|nr:DeoR family transcriptional regulator [Spirosoma aureum]QIP16199.1 DeoR family transcriptional regulator [Spirosoma aureum]